MYNKGLSISELKVISWLAIIISPKSVLELIHFSKNSQVQDAGLWVFWLWNQPLIWSVPFSGSSFIEVQTPEYMALIDQPIEMLDQLPHSIIIREE